MAISLLYRFIWLSVLASAQVESKKCLFDLTYAIDNNTSTFDGTPIYKIVPIVLTDFFNVKWMLYEEYCTITHAGTHMDAPRHFNETYISVDQIPLKNLFVRGVFIDIRYKSLNDSDSLLTLQDVLDYETEYGRIPKGAGVFQCSGWFDYNADPAKFFGNAVQDRYNLHYPSFSLEAVQFLVEERKIVGIGVDTPTIDYGQSRDFPVHHYAAANDVYGLEFMGDTCSVPAKGSKVYVFPMKFRDGSGGPTRVIAEWTAKRGTKCP